MQKTLYTILRTPAPPCHCERKQSRYSEYPKNQTNTLSFRGVAEKSPAEETRTSVHELPQTLVRAGSAPRGGSPPAGVPCRKKRFARFCRENRFSIYGIAFLRREPLISVSCGYTYSAFTEACFRDRSRFLSLPRRKFRVAPAITIPSCGYTYSAFTEACFRDRSRFLSFPKPFTSVTATAENRVVFYKTKKTG